MALAVGERAPDFDLPASSAQNVSLASVLGRGPGVLLWYVFDFGRI
jgi:peroxiredoxin